MAISLISALIYHLQPLKQKLVLLRQNTLFGLMIQCSLMRKIIEDSQKPTMQNIMLTEARDKKRGHKREGDVGELWLKRNNYKQTQGGIS